MTGLFRRGGTWTIRFRVPTELVLPLRKKEITYSLRTRDAQIARQRHAIERVKIEQQFADARRKLPAHPATLPDALTVEEIQRIVVCWFHEADRKRADRDREIKCAVGGANDNEVEEITEVMRGDETALRTEADFPNSDPGQLTWALRETRDLIDRHGLNVSESSTEFRRFRELVALGLAETYRRSRERLGDREGGKPAAYFAEISGDAPLPESFARPKQVWIGIEKLVDRFLAEKASSINPKTIDSYRAAAALFEQFVGSKTAITDLRRDNFVEFRNLLCRLPANLKKKKQFAGQNLQTIANVAEKNGLSPMANRTVNKTMETISTLFKYAARHDLIEKNPAEAVEQLNEGDESRGGPINLAQLRAIFSAPIYTGCQDDEHGYARKGPNVPRRSRFWVPLIALYSGMRLNEICQLYLEDVKTERGIEFFAIRINLDSGEKAPDKRLKNTTAKRHVPIHPELKRLGFMEYVESVRLTQSKRLFPELPRSSVDNYSDAFQKFFRRFLDKIEGCELADVSFHGFRHTFRDGLREARVHGEIVNRLGGWKESNSLASHYGAGYSLETLSTEIAKVSYLGLSLEHLVPLSSRAALPTS